MSSQVSWTKQLVLALILFLFGGAAYWYEFSHRPQEEAKQEQGKKIFPVTKEDAVQSIAIYDGNREFDLSCLDLGQKLCKQGDNSRWELEAPSKLKADDANANSLVSSIVGLDSADTLDLKGETPEKRAALLREYGLDASVRGTPAVRRLTIQLGDHRLVAYFGHQHPINEGSFTLLEKLGPGQAPGSAVDESKVYVTPSYFKGTFDHDLSYWREKKILTVATSEVAGFHLVDKKGDIRGERLDNKDRTWSLTGKGQGAAVPGDIEAVDSLISGATNLQAVSFVSESKTDEKAKAALKDSSSYLTLVLQPETKEVKPQDEKSKAHGTVTAAPVTLEVRLSKKGDKAYATVSNLDPLYEIPLASKDRLNQGFSDLRKAKLLTSLERFRVKRLEFTGAPMPSPLVLNEKNGGWVLDNDPAPEKVDQNKVQTLLDKLSSAKIQEFLKGPVPAGEANGIKLVVRDSKESRDGAPLPGRQFDFWKSGGKLYARESDPSSRDNPGKSKEAFLMDAQLQYALPWEPGFFNPAKKAEPGGAAAAAAPKGK